MLLCIEADDLERHGHTLAAVSLTVSVTDLFKTTEVCSEATEGRIVRDNRGMEDRIMDIVDRFVACGVGK
jgi:hypothetical protein